jgi:hypothetical protein
VLHIEKVERPSPNCAGTNVREIPETPTHRIARGAKSDAITALRLRTMVLLFEK